jgi:hypothetical protein
LEKHAGWLLALIAEHPDLTLDEAVTAMRRRRIVGSPPLAGLSAGKTDVFSEFRTGWLE